MDKVVTVDCEIIHKLCAELAQGPLGDRPINVMEVCGTHTMAIARSGLRGLLPERLKLITGPGCPVCVTDQSYMDQAVHLAKDPSVVIATYGDMVRVPGRNGSLAESRAVGAAVEVVYSTQQALELAAQRPQKQIVFLAVGFETTAPGTALAMKEARQKGIRNFSVLTAHKWIVPAMKALLSAGDVQIQGFLCPGHVSVIMGYRSYDAIAHKYARPCVVAGFDPGQIVAGLEEILRQLLADAPRACTVYPTVSAEGNPMARKLLDEVFEVSDVPWRALGVIPASGMALREEFAEFDAARRFSLPQFPSYEMPGCRCGDVICGRLGPWDCKLFAARCTPRDPIGPCMVSSEGACAAAFKYERTARTRIGKGTKGAKVRKRKAS